MLGGGRGEGARMLLASYVDGPTCTQRVSKACGKSVLRFIECVGNRYRWFVFWSSCCTRLSEHSARTDGYTICGGLGKRHVVRGEGWVGWDGVLLPGVVERVVGADFVSTIDRSST